MTLEKLLMITNLDDMSASYLMRSYMKGVGNCPYEIINYVNENIDAIEDELESLKNKGKDGFEKYNELFNYAVTVRRKKVKGCRLRRIMTIRTHIERKYKLWQVKRISKQIYKSVLI